MNSPLLSIGVAFWVEALVALLLVISGLLVLTGAVGLLRLKDFFQRMHPVAHGTTVGSWTACAASAAFFSALHDRAVIHALLIPVFLAVTMPITTLLLARAALFRQRAAGGDVPPPLTQPATGLRPEQDRRFNPEVPRRGSGDRGRSDREHAGGE
ncbi:MAG TPA: Na+/H+ antiporter subunit G [Lautropia sp.]|jgi:multicomponent K+:H+ antiporter subunit G|nr:Na+/H+ antiporter subunit G [Lautropia sp.]